MAVEHSSHTFLPTPYCLRLATLGASKFGQHFLMTLLQFSADLHLQDAQCAQAVRMFELITASDRDDVAECFEVAHEIFGAEPGALLMGHSGLR